MAREPRTIAAFRVEVAHGPLRFAGVSQDLGRGGVFVRITEHVPVGGWVELTLYAGLAPVAIRARVAHSLSEAEARALGRFPGLGFAFDTTDPEPLARIAADLGGLEKTQTHRHNSGSEMSVVVADSSTRLLERLSTALSQAGFRVVTATNGAEAFAACLNQAPDVVIAAQHMPVVDGMNLLRTLGSRPELAEIPVMMMSDEAGDIARLAAYQAGVRDFIPKPFYVVELCIRARRLARARRPQADRVVLRGSVAQLGVASLLSLFEYEQKSGILTIAHGTDVAWLSIASGRVVKARGPEQQAPSRELLMRVLDWRDGNFEFTACEVRDSDEVGMPTSHLLLEHAQVRDEQKAGKR